MCRKDPATLRMSRQRGEVVIGCTRLGTIGRCAAQGLIAAGILCLAGIMDREPQFNVNATAMTGRCPEDARWITRRSTSTW